MTTKPPCSPEAVNGTALDGTDPITNSSNGTPGRSWDGQICKHRWRYLELAGGRVRHAQAHPDRGGELIDVPRYEQHSLAARHAPPVQRDAAAAVNHRDLLAVGPLEGRRKRELGAERSHIFSAAAFEEIRPRFQK